MATNNKKGHIKITSFADEVTKQDKAPSLPRSNALDLLFEEIDKSLEKVVQPLCNPNVDEVHHVVPSQKHCFHCQWATGDIVGTDLPVSLPTSQDLRRNFW